MYYMQRPNIPHRYKLDEKFGQIIIWHMITYLDLIAKEVIACQEVTCSMQGVMFVFGAY